MALTIPTTQELADQALANLEAALNQTAPLNEKAFLRVLAAVEALTATGLYKFAAERSKQVLALTATGSDLDLIGAEFNVIRKPAISAVLAATLPGINGTIIPATAGFIGAPNNANYFIGTSVEIIGGVATLSLTAEIPGVDGNLQISDTLTIISPVAGAGQTAAVTALTTTGTEEETDEAYRQRVLFAERSVTGGGNATDHKIWAEQVEGCFRAFAYAGRPTGTSFPGDRSVYVEADSTIDPDGIPPSGLLDDVRESLTTDPDTGQSRPGLGQQDANLWVEPITRVLVDVTVTTLVTPSGQEASVKADIDSALALYLISIAPFVVGVDSENFRNDLITDPALSSIVQDILDSTGSSASGVTFEVATIPTSSYQLLGGELAKLGAVTYAV